jgi:hypothetical protein
MRKDWKYIMYVGGAFLLFVIVKLMAPKQHDWTMTLAHDDKDPYGTYALFELFPDLISGKNIEHSYNTILELRDSLNAGKSFFILATTFSCDRTETGVLLDHVSNGGNAFISAQYFRGVFADTLNLDTYDYFFKEDGITQDDSSFLAFENPTLDTTAHYFYLRDNINLYFERFDTTRTTIIAENDLHQPVALRIAYGKGSFILCSTPLVFTNIYLLSANNREFVSSVLSTLPGKNVLWTEFYQVGRMESSTPLRFILNNEPLAWAYYLTMSAVLIFMLFEAKRKQRIIPIVKPLPNTSLEFVSTIGNLYYQNGDHKNIAEKKINFLLEQIRSKYSLKTLYWNAEFFKALANKSGNTIEDVQKLFKKISFIQSNTMISAEQLMDLNETIERFFSAGDSNKPNN